MKGGVSEQESLPFLAVLQLRTHEALPGTHGLEDLCLELRRTLVAAQGKGAVLAVNAVEVEGKGSVLAAKAAWKRTAKGSAIPDSPPSAWPACAAAAAGLEPTLGSPRPAAYGRRRDCHSTAPRSPFK